MSNPATLADLTSYLRAGVRRVQKNFRAADEDWPQVFIVQNPDGLQVLPLPQSLFKNGRLKDGMAEVMRRAVVELGAYRYAVLLNTHMRLLPNATEEQRAAAEAYVERISAEQERVQESPDAIETLVMVVGDAEEEHLSMCQIERHAHRPPTLGRWEEWEGEDVGVSGRFTGVNEYMQEPRR